MDVNEEFLSKDFDVEKYARKLLDENASIPEQLAFLTTNTSALDRQLKEQISTHHEKLLAQATNIDSLEDTLGILAKHVSSLQVSGTRACDKVADLYRRTELRTKQLSRLHQACSLLRSAIRIVQLSNRLSSASSGDSAVQNLAKNSQLVQELKEISESEPDLKHLKIVERELSNIQKASGEMLSTARLTLKHGAKSQHQAQVGMALQAFHNLKCLDLQLEGYCKELVIETKQAMKHFEGFSTPNDEKLKSHETSSLPGSASLQQHTQSSVSIRSNVWNDVNRLVEFLVSVCTQLQTIHTVASKKREPNSHEFFEQLLGGREFYQDIWREITRQIEAKMSSSNILVKQTLEAEYPRLLRYFSTVFQKITQLKHLIPDGSDQLRSTMLQFESSYLSKSLARLFDTVNLLFQSASSVQNLESQNQAQQRSGSPTLKYLSKSEIDSLIRGLADEALLVKFDNQLYNLMAKNMAKTLQLFSVKCEQLTCNESDASQVIGAQTQGQKKNVDIANGLQYLRKEIEKLIESGQIPTCVIVNESILTLITQIRATFLPLLSSIEDGIAAILGTMQNESFQLDNSENQMQQQCSLYVKELQEFSARVWRDYLINYECKDLLMEQSVKMSRNSVQLFLVYATLVRPIDNLGRMRMIADFAQVELALAGFCLKIHDDLGDVYNQFKALRELFAIDSWENEGSKFRQKVPNSLLIHMLISQSPDEFKSPHSALNWSLIRYAEWLVRHNDEKERLQFLKGTIEAYAKQVQQEGKINYVPLYPLIVELLNSGFDSA